MDRPSISASELRSMQVGGRDAVTITVDDPLAVGVIPGAGWKWKVRVSIRGSLEQALFSTDGGPGAKAIESVTYE